MIPVGRVVAAAIVALSFPAGHARAAGPSVAPAPPADPTTLGDDELDRQRGGFVWAGMTISLGAEIRSYVDGKLVARTDVVWGDAGASVRRTVAADAVVGDAGNSRLATAALRAGAGDGAVVLANQGRTAFVQAVGGSLRSVVLNTADRTDLRQEMDVAIGIATIAPLRRAAVASLVGSSLASLGRR